MSANAKPGHLSAMSDFGYALGLAFQVIDDILDVTQTSEKLGKSAGKDAAAQKATYPAVLGLEKSRLEAGRLTRRGVALSGGALASVLCGNASAAVPPDFSVSMPASVACSSSWPWSQQL